MPQGEKFLHGKFMKTTIIDAFYYFVLYMYISFLSPYLSTLGWTESLKGLFFTAFSAVGILAAPIAGTLSDKLGRFRLIIFGIVLEIVSLTGYIFITDTTGLFLIRIVSAIAFNAVTITALSRMHDTVLDNHYRAKKTGVFNSILSVAALAAPLIGGFIADNYGYTSIFVVAQIIMIIVLFGLIIYDSIFYDDKKQVHRKRKPFKWRDVNPFKDVFDMLKFPKLRIIATVGFIVNFTVPLMILVLPYYIIDVLGLSNSHLSIAIFLIAASHAMQFIMGIVADRIGKRKGMVVGLSIVGLFFILMFFANSFEIFLIFIFLRGIGAGLWNVSAWASMSNLAEKHEIEGKVVGSYSSISRMAITISFALSGFILVAAGSKIFLIYGILTILPILIFGHRILNPKKSIA